MRQRIFFLLFMNILSTTALAEARNAFMSVNPFAFLMGFFISIFAVFCISLLILLPFVFSSWFAVRVYFHWIALRMTSDEEWRLFCGVRGSLEG